jgi:hypothetical protein
VVTEFDCGVNGLCAFLFRICFHHQLHSTSFSNSSTLLTLYNNNNNHHQQQQQQGPSLPARRGLHLRGSPALFAPTFGQQHRLSDGSWWWK